MTSGLETPKSWAVCLNKWGKPIAKDIRLEDHARSIPSQPRIAGSRTMTEDAGGSIQPSKVRYSWSIDNTHFMTSGPDSTVSVLLLSSASGEAA